MKIELPEFCLVMLIGSSGCGKSTFARRHFKSTEVISSDFCRGIVCDDENDQTVSSEAFSLVRFIAGQRLALGKLTVIDATSVQAEDRKSLLEIAKTHNTLPIAIVMDIDEKICQQRNQSRADRDFGPHVISRQARALARSLKGLKKEGFNRVFILDSPEEVDQVEITRVPLWNNKKDEKGPFDIIGDIHGCFDETAELLTKLGYELVEDSSFSLKYRVCHPENRRVIFVGDLVDRGPKTPDVLRLVMSMVASGTAFCVAGNHDVKLLRKLLGKNVNMTHGLKESWEQLEPESDQFRQEVSKFLDSLISHYLFDDGRLVVAHAGLKEAYQGRSSGRVREFCLYGETTGETDEYGLPVRYNWAQDYRGKALVAYGHTPVPRAQWLNNTICLDTGCVFGGELTALRYPEKELVKVNAAKTYYQPVKPLQPPQPLLAQSDGGEECLSIKDVIGKRIINTRLMHSITVREENAAAALEIMSRFAVNPNWLVYLPPTMSPCASAKQGPYLEHASEALAYFRDAGVEKLICEEKHMGSRAVIIVCKNEEAARARFKVEDEGIGVVYTRTGRPFFNDQKLASEFLTKIRDAANLAGLFDELESDWLLLDAELMPWSLKAQDLLRRQYASTGTAAMHSLCELESLSAQAEQRGLDLSTIKQSFAGRKEMVSKYVDAYRRYCWPVQSLKDLKLAPFHLLASEGRSHTDKTHLWHLAILGRLARADSEELIIQTAFKCVDLKSESEQDAVISWWESLTASGGEGMVLKPQEFICHGRKGLLQPAVKCRGREYLRIIYGPEYDDHRYLDRLRQRGLAAKRSLALREFALSLESLERFVSGEPLYRVHECVFALLALESEPVDPRL